MLILSFAVLSSSAVSKLKAYFVKKEEKAKTHRFCFGKEQRVTKD